MPWHHWLVLVVLMTLVVALAVYCEYKDSEGSNHADHS